MRSHLELDFLRFASSLRGAEYIDDIPMTEEQALAEKADFFFNERSVVCEVKTLQTDTEPKIESVLEPYRGTKEWPVF